MKYKKNGFTMVELITVIAIVGILTVAVFTSVTALLKKSQQQYYNTQEKMMILSGKDFFSDARSRLPKEIGKTSKVYLETLITEKYIDPVLDKEGNACYYGKSYVEAQKVSSEEYNYYYYLECKNYKSGKELADTEKPVIVFNPNSKSSKTGFTVTITITDNVKVASFKYVIKNKSTGKETSIPYKKYKSSEKVKLSGDSIYQITAYAIDSSDNKTTKISGEYIIDNTPPTCGAVSGDSKEWTGKNREIKIGCSDNASGCVSETYKKNFTETTREGKITISDKSGNTRDCPVDVYVDKTGPSCGSVSGDSTSWTKNNRNISVGCKDNESGCKESRFYNNFTSTTQKGTIVISDEVGNETSCSVNAYVDKDRPICGSSIGDSRSWTGNSRTVGVNCSDSGSGCTRSSFYDTFYDTTTTSEIEIRDEAGNTNYCPVNVYVDRTPPSCNGTWGDTNIWTSGSRSIGAYCKDDESGCTRSSFSNVIDYTTQFGYVTIYDQAGNSNSCQVEASVDKEPPECGTVTGESTTPTNGNRTITVKCNDSKSGCKKDYYTQTYTTEQTYNYITIEDNAGNSKSCRVSVFIDKTPPSSCPQIVPDQPKNEWTKNSVTFTFTFPSDIATYDWYTTTDGTNWKSFSSGNSRYATSKTITGDGSHRQGRLDVYDAAGNMRQCLTSIHMIDKTPPTCSISSGSTVWAKGTRKITATCSDNLSKCVTSSDFETIGKNETVKTQLVSFSFKDNAGNKGDCSKTANIYIDNNGPTVTKKVFHKKSCNDMGKEYGITNISCSGNDKNYKYPSVIVLTATDTASKLGTRTVSWDGGSSTGTLSGTTQSDFLYSKKSSGTATYTYKDKLGNATSGSVSY